MRYTIVAAAAIVSTAIATPLTTIDPCPAAPSKFPEITVTSQYQPVSYCVPTSTCSSDTCTTDYAFSTSTYVSTVIPCAVDGTSASSCTVTKTDQIVPCSEYVSTITNVTPIPTVVVNGNLTKSTTLYSTDYETVSKEWSAPYNKIGPHGIPGYEGSGLCSDCDAKSDGAQEQFWTINECHAAGGAAPVCSNYPFTWVSRPAPSATASTHAVVSSKASATAAGTYTYTFPQVAPQTTISAKGQVITVPAQPWFAHVTTQCHGPTVFDFTVTITKTITYYMPFPKTPSSPTNTYQDWGSWESAHATPPHAGANPTHTGSHPSPAGSSSRPWNPPQTNGNDQYEWGHWQVSSTSVSSSKPTSASTLAPASTSTSASSPTTVSISTSTSASSSVAPVSTSTSSLTSVSTSVSTSASTSVSTTTSISTSTSASIVGPGSITTTTAGHTSSTVITTTVHTSSSTGTSTSTSNTITSSSSSTPVPNPEEFIVSILTNPGQRFRKRASHYVGFPAGNDASSVDFSQASRFHFDSDSELRTGSEFILRNEVAGGFLPFEKAAASLGGANKFFCRIGSPFTLSGATFCLAGESLIISFGSSPAGCSPVSLFCENPTQTSTTTTSTASVSNTTTSGSSATTTSFSSTTTSFSTSTTTFSTSTTTSESSTTTSSVPDISADLDVPDPTPEPGTQKKRSFRGMRY